MANLTPDVRVLADPYYLDLDIYLSTRLELISLALFVALLIWVVGIVAVCLVIILRRRSDELRDKISEFKKNFTDKHKHYLNMKTLKEDVELESD